MPAPLNSTALNAALKEYAEGVRVREISWRHKICMQTLRQYAFERGIKHGGYIRRRLDAAAKLLAEAARQSGNGLEPLLEQLKTLAERRL